MTQTATPPPPAASSPRLASIPIESGPEPRARPANKWAIAIAVALGALLEVVDTSIVNVALTDIQAALGASLTEVSWVVSSYAVANVIILPMTAWLGQRFGKKRYFIFSLIAFTISSVLCGTAQSLSMLIAARAIQGLGGGGLLAKAQSILFETFPKNEQAMAQGFFGIIVIAGPAIGPTLGGYLTTNIDWRWIFFINVPVGIAAVLMCATFLVPDEPRSARAVGGIDWWGIALLTAGLGALQTLLEEGQQDDWFDSSFICGCLALAVVSLTAFVIREMTTDHPVVDLRVLRYRLLWSGSIMSVVIGMALYGALFAIPIFTQSILHFTAEDTGWLLFPSALTAGFAFPIAARLLARVDPRVMLAGGALILATAVIQLAHLSPQTGTADLFWPLILRSFGTVFMFLPLTMATIGPLPKKDVAAATGFFSLTRQMGGSIGVAILTVFLQRREAFHRTVLIEKVVQGSTYVEQRLGLMAAALSSNGVAAPAARQKAVGILDGAVSLQAAVMSFGDTFWATAVLILATLPLVLLLGKPSKGRPAIDAGH